MYTRITRLLRTLVVSNIGRITALMAVIQLMTWGGDPPHPPLLNFLSTYFYIRRNSLSLPLMALTA